MLDRLKEMHLQDEEEERRVNKLLRILEDMLLKWEVVRTGPEW